MTSLYEALTLTLQRRFLEQIGKPNTWKWTQTDIKRDLEVQDVFSLLESIAWVGFQEKRLLFSFASRDMKELFRKNSKNKIKQLCKSGFIQSTGESVNSHKNEHSFLHLTFQEFFAAHYIARLFQEQKFQEAAKLLKRVK